MAYQAVLFRMKMKKTQNVLRMKSGNFLKFFFHRKMKERRNGEKLYQLSFFLAGLSRKDFLRKIYRNCEERKVSR